MFYRKSLLTLAMIIAFQFQIAYTQDKYDNTWITGYPGGTQAQFFGGNNMTFNNGFPQTTWFDLVLKIKTPCSVSNSKGELQFYTNGCAIANREHQIMENGGGINPGNIANSWCGTSGYPGLLSMVSMPYPNHSDRYILFHLRRYQSSPVQDLLFTEIDMSANGGLGKVVQKNQFLVSDSLNNIQTAVRHGNGRDWWLVTPKENRSTYYLHLLDSAGVHGSYIRQPEAAWDSENSLGCVFSPDGSKFVRCGAGKPPIVKIYDFDRCTGNFSNPINILLPDTFSNASITAFAPGGRYLYISNDLRRVYQFDTWASNISSTAVLVGEIDNWLSIYGLLAGPFAPQLAPDGKIYITSGNGVNVLHTIHRPDEPGLACDYRGHDLLLPAHVQFNPPIFPNYRLYDLPGSPCDTAGVNAPIWSFWRSELDSVTSPLAVGFFDLSYAHPVSWHWDFGDGGTSNLPNPSHVFPLPGKYQVCLTACNEAGQCDSLCRFVEVGITSTVVPLPKNETSVRVFPNPSTEFVWVAHPEIIGVGKLEFSLFNSIGQLAKQQELQNGDFAEQVLLAGLPPGTYFWRLAADSKILKSGAFFIF